MELENFKSDYKNAGNTNLGKEKIQNFLLENNHPVLKKMKVQLVLETILWTVFLAVYYDFFDGHQKPLLWNILLVVAVVLIQVHNFLGYKIIQNPIHGKNIRRSLENYLKKIREYSIISIASRVLAIAIILGFFISTIQFTQEKYWILGILAMFFPIQTFLLQRVWSVRIVKIKDAVEKLKA